MAVVLTPILKSSLAVKQNSPCSTNHVTFSIPEDDVIEYLRNEDVPHSAKLHAIVSKITSQSTEDTLLLKWIRDFKDNILFLEHKEKIILALLSLNWYKKDDEFVSIYQDLVLNLVTAHPSFLKNVLTMVVKLFFSVQDPDVEEITNAEERQFENAHVLLKNIIKLVPLCEQPLCVILTEKFPYMKQPAKTLNCYVKNLLHLCSYFPSKKLIILECVIERIIHIDVLCSRKVIEMAEIQREQEELMDQDLINEDVAKTKDTMAFPIAHTVDVMMDSVFKFIQQSCFPKGDENLDWECTKKVYKELLTVFDKIILSTPASVHVQYIMFYICSLKQELSDGFLDYLWKKVQNPSISSVYRQIASFYIGSLLSRAKYVNISTVIACLDLFCNWIHSYIDNHTVQDLSVHGTFHSVCQTVFYVFAFRNQELLEKDKGLKFLRSLNFERIVTCRLNPLRYCDRNIVQNFANIARNFQIAYVYPVIEKNNRNLLYLSNSQANKEFNAGAMIQTYFPFDPYLLKRSKHWIEPCYRIYNHCQKEKEEEAMDIIDEDETNVSDSLFTYGSSPGFKKSYLSKR